MIDIKNKREKMSQSDKKISFQGSHGAYHEQACRAVYPDMETLPCETFEDTFAALEEGRSDYAMIAVDNTLAGRVADVHHLLPESGFHIVAEYFLPIRHALLGVKGASVEGLTDVHSHVHAIPQCRKMIRKYGLKAHIQADTAGSAMMIAENGDVTQAAIASSLAGDLYGLDVLIEDVQDAEHNTTRFLVLSKEAQVPAQGAESLMTSFVFRVRNIPAALYKALGGFATNGVNMTKLESYVDEKFQAAQFYCDVEGHPEDENLRLALEELDFFAKELRIMGTYPAHPFRKLGHK